MKSTISHIVPFFLALCTLVAGDASIGLCCLCSKCGPAVSGRGNLAINAKGYTCSQLILDMADPSNGMAPGSNSCKSLKNQWYNHCCNSSYKPPTIAQSPTPSPGDKYPKGPYSACNVCKNKKYPGYELTLVAVLDHPTVKTCRDLYWYSLRGNFQDRLCRPMQNYYQGPCGCNI